ncbi:Zinc finger and SCAN domain-containing protein 10 [Folsomia candida]|uniref:Zinc finger and SCAN domain-containing protein 10 n=1 Tax=Folsomia candida TaxID=158441 RepID=A0A226D5Y6_FOLCA|nr:Zinc finger and SCAN domain-containing protein 10 [Folsomia candida]
MTDPVIVPVLPTSQNPTVLLKGAYSFNLEKDDVSEKIFRCNNLSCPVRLHTSKSANNPEIKTQNGTHNHSADPKVQVQLVWRTKTGEISTTKNSISTRKFVRPCGNCGKKGADLVSTICLRGEDEAPPENVEGTNFPISDALFSLALFWLGFHDKPGMSLFESSPLLELCPPCAKMFTEIYKISMQFQSLGEHGNQVITRIKILRERMNKSVTATAKLTEEIAKTGQKGNRKQKINTRDANSDDEEAEECHTKEKCANTETTDFKNIAEVLDISKPGRKRNRKQKIKARDADEEEECPPKRKCADFKNREEVHCDLDVGTGLDLVDATPAVQPFQEGDDLESPHSIPPLEQNSPQPKRSHSFQCSACPKKLSTLPSLRRHFRHEHDPAFTRYTCPVPTCGGNYKFNQFFSLKYHMDKKHPGVPVPPKRADLVPDPGNRIYCPVVGCGKSYVERTGVYHHMRRTHPAVPFPKIPTKPEAMKSCPVCGKKVVSRTQLCTKCGKLFRTARDLRVHDVVVHIREKKHACAICGAAFVLKSGLDKHVLFRHEVPPDLRFSCDTCGKSYRRLRSLQEHVGTHTSKDFQCSLCARVFPRRSHLTGHMKRIHGSGDAAGEKGGKDFHCDKCSKPFRRKAHLVRHMKRMYDCGQKRGRAVKEKSEKEGDEKSGKAAEENSGKDFQCRICSKSYNRNYNLRRHMRGIHGIEEKSGKARGEKSGKSAGERSRKSPGEKRGKLAGKTSGKAAIKVVRKAREYKKKKSNVSKVKK